MRKLKNSVVIILLVFCCISFVGCNDISVTFNVQYNCFEYQADSLAGSTLVFHNSQKVTFAGQSGVYTTRAKFLGERYIEIIMIGNNNHLPSAIIAKVKGDIVYIYRPNEQDPVAGYKKAVI